MLDFQSRFPLSRQLSAWFTHLTARFTRVPVKFRRGRNGRTMVATAAAVESLEGRVLLSAAAAEVGAAADVPAPFWHKTGDSPSFAPAWYDNVTPVTREFFYDNARTSVQNGNALEAVLENLSAGDHVVVHGGTYTFDSRLFIQGFATAESPIRISAATGEEIVLLQGDSGQNSMEIDNASYLILEGFEITGGDAGVRLNSVDHIMMFDNELHDFANNAITANTADTSYLYFIDNEIYDTADHGEGFYLGANDGSKITHHTYVVGNYVHDTNNSDVTQGDGIEIKDKSYAVTVKWNYVENTNYPGIIAYGTGRGAVDRNIIEENVVLFSDDNAIQVSAEAIVRNNLVVTDGTALMSKPETTNPRHLSIVNNTFITSAQGVRTYGWGEADATNIVFANNAIYSASGQYLPQGVGNATSVGNVLVTDLNETFVNLSLDGLSLDATPAPGSPLIGAAIPAYLPESDLSGTARSTEPDAGAVDFREDGAAVSATINGGDLNRSGIRDLTFEFASPVMLNVDTGLSLFNQTTGESIDVSGSILVNNGTTAVTWDLSAIVLPDGRYTVELTTDVILTALGSSMLFEFHKLSGDVNGDGVVSNSDYRTVNAYFGSISGGSYDPGDANGDGVVSNSDYRAVNANFGTVLPAH